MTTPLEKEVTRICKEHASGYDSGMAGFMRDLHYGGCQSGLVGALVYYSDTVKFHDEFEDDIWNLLYESAQDSGVNILTYVGSMNGAENVGTADQFKNLLAWFAFEETAFRLFDN